MSDNVIVRAGEIASANVGVGERVYIRGSDGFSPTVSISEIPGGHSVSITDANGTQSFSVLDGVAELQSNADALSCASALRALLTAANNGKVLGIVNGALAAAELGSLIPDGDEVSY